MRVRARTIVLGLLGLIILVVLGGITAVGWAVVLGPKARAVTDRKFDPTPARLARGKYIVEGPAGCFHCHSDHDFSTPEYPTSPGKRGAGWPMPIPEVGLIASRNITADRKTGIGAWTDDEIARAIGEGVSRDGSALFPVMPYLSFAQMDDEDLASVVVYVRTIPAVRNVVPTRQLVFPLNVLVNTMPQPVTTPHLSHPSATAIDRGKYLATIANCVGCHTPTDDRGTPLPGMEFAGGGIFHDPGKNLEPVFSLNITPDASGIAFFDEALFIQTLRTGKLGGASLNHIMPFEYFRNMTDDDLRDLWAFIHSQKPVKHRVSNTDAPAECAACKQKHGLGELNK